MPATAARRLLLSNKYEVERVLGRGGMGTVYQARHTRLGHRVAIKVLDDELYLYPDLVTRFEREARAASALRSPHAVRVFDIDATDEGAPFIVMELLSGYDLGRVLAKLGPQPVGTAVRWIVEACDAIGEAHRLGIIHRDIKPSNLLLCDVTASIKVLDFGVAKRMESGDATITGNATPLGTPQYMSPEQVRCSHDVDARADVWSLGVTLFELLTGRPPFDHEIPQACIAAIVVDPVPDPRTFRADLPEALAAVILRALEKDVALRYQSVDELVRALLPFADRPSSLDLASWSVIAELRARAVEERRTREERTGVEPREAPRRASSLGRIGAAVLGLAAIVATTRFADTRGPAPSAPRSPPSSSPALPDPEATLARAEEEPLLSAEPAAVAVDDQAAEAAAQPATASRRASSGARPLPKLPPPRAPRGGAVHGGISSPGF